MTTDYAQYWQPASFEEAEFQIDTGHSGDAFWQWGHDRAYEMLATLPDIPDTVLDYGCGVGRVLGCMPGQLRVGVDVSAEMLEYAKMRYPECVFLRGNGRSIPLPEGSVDFAYSLLVLQHMDADDVMSVTRDVGRVLRAGGDCYLQFSGFGTPFAVGRMLERSGCHWPGQRSGAYCGAHSAMSYREADLAGIAKGMGLRSYSIDRQTIDPERPYLILRGRK